MKKYLFAIAALCLAATTIAAESRASNGSTETLKKVRSVLPQGWFIVKVVKGPSSPNHYAEDAQEAVVVLISNPSIDAKMKSKAKIGPYELYLMDLRYKEKSHTVSALHPEVAERPARYLGRSEHFKIYWGGGMWGLDPVEKKLEADVKQALSIATEK